MRPASSSADPTPQGFFARAGFALLLVYVLVFFARPQDIYGFAFPGLLKLIAFPLIGCWVLAVVVERVFPRLAFPQMRMVFVLLGLMCVSLPFAYITMYAYGMITYLCQSILLVLVIASTFAHTRPRFQVLIRVFAFAAAWLALEGVRFYVLPGGGRWRGSFAGHFLDDVNDYALFMCTTAPLLVYCALTSTRKGARWLWWGCAAAGLGAVVYSFSRGGMVALLGMAGYGLLRLSGNRTRLILIGAVVGLGFLLLLPASYWENFTGAIPRVGPRGQVEFDDSSAEARYHAWSAGLAMAKEHPFVGVGPGSFESAMWVRYRPAGVTRDRAAHSMYFQLLGELGVPGLVWVLGLIWINIRATRAMERAAAAADDRDAVLLARALEIGFAGFLVGAAFLTVAYYPTIYWLSWFIGMHQVLGAQSQPAPEPAPAPRPKYRLVRA